MKQSKLTVAIYTTTLIISIILMCCEAPKKAKRENADDPGNPDAWNTSIHDNATEMLTFIRGPVDGAM